MQLTIKMILAFILVSLVPLILFSIVGLESIDQYSEQIIDKTREDLRRNAEQAVLNKALDVARQLEIYFQSNSFRNLEEMHADSYLRSIAVQKVGATGYTAIHRRDGVNVFNRQQRFEGMNILNGGRERRLFYEFSVLFQKSLKTDAYETGYYSWMDSGKTLNKFAAMVPIANTDFILTATISVAEFDLPVQSTERTMMFRKGQLQLFLLLVAGFILAVVIICGFIVSMTLTRPIAQLQAGLMAFTRGDLDYRIPIKTRDELGTLSLMFNQMADELSAKSDQLSDKNSDIESSERKYRRLVENLHDLAAYIDTQEKFSFVSPRIKEQMGYSPDDLIGKKYQDLIHPEDIGYVIAHFSEAIRSKERDSKIELRMFNKTGDYRTLSIRTSFLYNDQGRWNGTVAVARDVTEERRMEAEIRLLSLVVEQSGDGIAAYNLEGNILFANLSWAQMHGWADHNDLTDRNINRFHSEEEALHLQDVMQEVLAEGKWTGDIRHIRKDNTTFLALCSCSLLRDTAGRNIGYIMIVTDITERKRIEDNLRQYSDDLEILVQQRTRELQEKNRQLQRAIRKGQDAEELKNQFMGQVSRELRTPLNSIILFYSPTGNLFPFQVSNTTR